MSSAVIIDGSYGEGGGQILRTSLSLSVITGRPIEIGRIRAGRTKPGLQPQHLAAVRAAASLCAADLTGANVGSTHLFFRPQASAAPGAYHFDIGTAGAAPLVLQTVLLPLALADAPSRVTVTGGTHVPHAPTAEYLDSVYAALLRRHGLAIRLSSPSAGFFPRGGGMLTAEIGAGASLQPVALTERGTVKMLTASIVTSRLPPDVPERGVNAVRQGLQKLPGNLTVEAREVVSLGPGAAIILVAETETGAAGFSAVGERGKRMEAVAEDACGALWQWYRSGAACEEHLADQLALPMALTPGLSRWTTSRVTEHLRTALWVLPQFLPVEVSLEESDNGTGTVSLRGASL